MQSKIKTKDSSTIQQVSATYTNNFPADGKIGEQINISPQTHQDEISNNNKYNTLNTDKERQLKPQLAIINQHSSFINNDKECKKIITSGKIFEAEIIKDTISITFRQTKINKNMTF